MSDNLWEVQPRRLCAAYMEGNPAAMICTRCGWGLADHMNHRCYVDIPCDLCGKPQDAAQPARDDREPQKAWRPGDRP